ncbi:MAG: Na-translocating system protein MpsC family protein [Tepidisphaeraceae bacterium]
MKTQGEIESAISDGMSRFEQEYMGRGPKDIRAHLIDNLIVVRLEGVLTAAEQHLVKTLQPEKGRDLLKQVRTHLIETARPIMEAMVQGITGVKVLSLHHDISTVTGADFTALVTNLGKTASGGDVVLPASVYSAVDAYAAANGLMVDVPEPSTFGLLGLAAAGVLAR